MADNMTPSKESPSGLTLTREPKAKAKVQDGSLGAVALNDAIMLVAICWGVLLLLAFSLRRYNI